MSSEEVSAEERAPWQVSLAVMLGSSLIGWALILTIAYKLGH